MEPVVHDRDPDGLAGASRGDRQGSGRRPVVNPRGCRARAGRVVHGDRPSAVRGEPDEETEAPVPFRSGCIPDEERRLSIVVEDGSNHPGFRKGNSGGLAEFDRERLVRLVQPVVQQRYENTGVQGAGGDAQHALRRRVVGSGRGVAVRSPPAHGDRPGAGAREFRREQDLSRVLRGARVPDPQLGLGVVFENGSDRFIVRKRGPFRPTEPDRERLVGFVNPVIQEGDPDGSRLLAGADGQGSAALRVVVPGFRRVVGGLPAHAHRGRYSRPRVGR